MDDTKQEYNRLAKFFGTLGLTFLWCLATFFATIFYGVAIKILIKFYLLPAKPFSAYSIPLFYIILFMSIGMILGIFKKLQISENLSVFRSFRKVHLKYIIKYGFIGTLFSVVGGIGIFFMFLLIIGLEYGMVALGNQTLYGSDWVGFVAIGTLIITFMLYFLASIKEGIRHGNQNRQ
jgi:hypothetical protein